MEGRARAGTALCCQQALHGSRPGASGSGLQGREGPPARPVHCVPPGPGLCPGQGPTVLWPLGPLVWL